ncbi:MAG: hypothetical protein OIF32_04920 [Campylobacterales bacterium]|nr:hypothetical protein [Campylobacterales bacterium]
MKDYKSNFDSCKAVISDGYIKTEKPLLIVGSDEDAVIKKPFTKTSLMLTLDKMKKQIELSRAIDDINEENQSDIDKQIEKLTQQFATEVASLLKKKYQS